MFDPSTFHPTLYVFAHEEMRAQSRPFQAVRLTEGNIDDLAAWTGGTKTAGGLVLPSGRSVPFEHWVYRQDDHFLGMSNEGFETMFARFARA